jgi:hypothetical protein
MVELGSGGFTGGNAPPSAPPHADSRWSSSARPGAGGLRMWALEPA